jgi:hypothetical protein
MTRTSEGQSDDSCRRDSRRWQPLRAAWDRWIARVRPGFLLPRKHRLLFLDDDPNRARLFLRDHPRAVWVTTVPDCLARLAESWYEVHLDHDLGGKMYVDSADTDCGMEVIRWLCKEPRPHLKRTRFFVHTHNATAGLLMVLLMQCGGYKAEFRPFGLDLERLLAHNETGSGADSRRNRWIGGPGSLRSAGNVAAMGVRMLAAWGARLYHAPARDGRPRASGGGPVSPASGDPQGAMPESGPSIQPPPRTRSS